MEKKQKKNSSVREGRLLEKGSQNISQSVGSFHVGLSAQPAAQRRPTPTPERHTVDEAMKLCLKKNTQTRGCGGSSWDCHGSTTPPPPTTTTTLHPPPLHLRGTNSSVISTTKRSQVPMARLLTVEEEREEVGLNRTAGGQLSFL